MSKRECEVYLEPIEHVYISKIDGTKYKSVTTVLSMLEPEFNSEEVAEAIVRQDPSKKKEQYQNLTKEEILLEWKRINDEANVYGTKIHELMERYLLANRLYIPKDDFERNIITSFQKIDPMTKGKIYPETVLFSKPHSIAGTSDLIEDCDSYFNVYDYKTNKDFNFISKYDHWLNKPLSYLSDCQYNIYSVQLSIYAYMYQLETKKKVGRLGLFYLDPITLEFRIIPVPYLALEAKTLLDYWREQNG